MTFESSLVTAKDLDEFAGTTQSRGLLPHIVRWLLANTAGVRGLSMPAGEGVWRGEWDGYVEHIDGNGFVPDGALCWEMSTARRVGSKANENYAKRTRDPKGIDPAKTTFLFATMRHWPKKHEWVRAKRAEGIWRDVRAMDSEDLWAWLESDRDVHIWASKQMGRQPRRELSGSTAPAQLLADVQSFVGREDELGDLSAALEQLNKGGFVVVSGQPGVGKTAFAVRFAHEHVGNFPDGQLYIDLRGTHSDSLATDTILTRVLRALGVPAEAEAGSTGEMAAAFRAVAAQKRFILVLDNAANEQQVRSLMPGKSNSLVIVTSRDQLGGLDCFQRIHLDTLTIPYAVAMLVSNIGDSRATAEPAALVEIARLCGLLPLALQIAARLAQRSPSWRLEYLAERLRDEKGRLDRLKTGDLEVRASFQLSYNLLVREQRVVFRKLCLIPGATFDVHLAKVTLRIKKLPQVELLIQELVDRGLVELAATEGRYRIHDLLRLFGEEKFEEETSETKLEALSGVRGYLLRSVEQANLVLQPGYQSDLDQKVREVAQAGDALIWLDDNFDNLMAVIHDAINDGIHNDAITGIMGLHHYLELRASWVSLRALALLGCAVLERVRVKGIPNEAVTQFVHSTMLTLLAKSANGLRNYDEALSYCDQAAARGGSDELLSIGVVQNIRGIVLRSMNRHAEALAAFQQCAAFWKVHDPRQLRLIEHNIGATLMDMGKLNEAITYLYRDLAGCREDDDVLGEAHTLNTIGLAWRLLNNIEESQKALMQAVLGFRCQHDRVHEGDALNDLGLVLYAQEKYDEAYQCHLLDLAYCQQRQDWHGSALALIRLVDNLLSKDDAHAALAFQYIKIALSYLDTEKDRKAVAAALVILADIGYAIDQAEHANQYYRSAVAICREIGYYDGQLDAYTRQFAHAREHGNTEGALAAVGAAIDLAKDHDRPHQEAQLLRHLADLLAECGRTHEGAEALTRAQQLLDCTP